MWFYGPYSQFSVSPISKFTLFGQQLWYFSPVMVYWIVNLIVSNKYLKKEYRIYIPNRHDLHLIYVYTKYKKPNLTWWKRFSGIKFIWHINHIFYNWDRISSLCLPEIIDGSKSDNQSLNNVRFCFSNVWKPQLHSEVAKLPVVDGRYENHKTLEKNNWHLQLMFFTGKGWLDNDPHL